MFITIDLILFALLLVNHLIIASMLGKKSERSAKNNYAQSNRINSLVREIKYLKKILSKK